MFSVTVNGLLNKYFDVNFSCVILFKGFVAISAKFSELGMCPKLMNPPAILSQIL